MHVDAIYAMRNVKNFEHSDSFKLLCEASLTLLGIFELQHRCHDSDSPGAPDIDLRHPTCGGVGSAELRLAKFFAENKPQ